MCGGSASHDRKLGFGEACLFSMPATDNSKLGSWEVCFFLKHVLIVSKVRFSDGYLFGDLSLTLANCSQACLISDYFVFKNCDSYKFFFVYGLKLCFVN